MNVTPLALPAVLLIEPAAFRDERGMVFESWQDPRYREVLASRPFVQDNVSVSRRGVIRGLHFQHPRGQGKLVSVLAGAAYDVAVDVRRTSPTFGRWVAAVLSEANGRQMWVPAGFAHGVQALSDGTVLHYKCSDLHSPESSRTVRWSDSALGIPWPLADVVLSARDAAAPLLDQIPAEHLPAFA